MRSLKRMLAVMLAVVMMMGLGVTSMAAENQGKNYLSDLRAYAGVESKENIIKDFKPDKLEYSIIVPNKWVSIGAKLSENAPENSKIVVYYTCHMFGYSWDNNDKLENSDSGGTDISAMLSDETVEGSAVEIKVGVEGDADADIQEDIQTYMIYVHREGTKSALLTTKLEALPEVSALTLVDKDAVAEARAAYDELTDAQKELMAPSLIQKLTDSEAKIAELTKAEEDSKKAAAVTEKLEALPEVTALTLADKDAVAEARTAYDELTDAQKELITPSLVQKLTDSEAKIVELTKAEEDKKQETPTTEAKPATKPSNPQIKTVAVKKGKTFTVKGYKYKVTSNLVKNPTVTVVGYKNKKLTKVNVASTVNYKKVNFKVTAIGNKAFKNQKKAKSIVIGKNVKTIGTQAFAGDSKVKKITVKSTVLDKVGSKAFSGIDKKAVIKVPAKQLKSYKKMMKNKGQKKTVKITK